MEITKESFVNYWSPKLPAIVLTAIGSASFAFGTMIGNYYNQPISAYPITIYDDKRPGIVINIRNGENIIMEEKEGIFLPLNEHLKNERRNIENKVK